MGKAVRHLTLHAASHKVPGAALFFFFTIRGKEHPLFASLQIRIWFNFVKHNRIMYHSF